MNPREILIYLSLKFNGDYHLMKNAIENHEEIDLTDEKLPPIKANVVTILDEDYPPTLKMFYQCPLVLYYYGDLSLLQDFSKNLAVIGTRHNSYYGALMTNKIVKYVAEDVNIVSGLARGIDTIAHRAAINNKGRTIAVLGSGIDYCHPLSNQDLYEEIKKNHLVISEYPNDVMPTPDKFPVRNRLIAMISSTILVTEAHYRSGSQITVGFGIGFNKDICAVPDQVTNESYCNKIIKEGAYAILCGHDLVDIMKIVKNKPIFEK